MKRIMLTPCTMILVLMAMTLFFSSPTLAKSTQEKALQNIGVETFVYTYPLVLMDLTRLQMTNIEPGKMAGRGPMMTFTHVRTFPEADHKEVVRPNFDTLYSLAWLDLTKEPVILSVPEEKNRFYMLPLLDMWTDVFAVIGTLTTGTAPGHYAIALPDWKGELPDGVTRIDAPTPYVWVLGRTQTNGPKDYPTVHKIQDGYKLCPLSSWGKAYAPPALKIDPTVDMKTPPLDQVNSMSAKAYFEYAVELMKQHKPHITDQSIMARMRQIGIEPGKSLDFNQLEPAVQKALNSATAKGLKLMQVMYPKMGTKANGWNITTEGMGVYGNDYLFRGIIAMIGLGANPAEQAIYPVVFTDSDGKPVTGDNNYVLHFPKEQLPPVKAFWSVTMYDEQGFQAANALNRFALGDRDDLTYNADGSLDIYIQHTSPGKSKESNWLPAPKGSLGVTLRLYGPNQEALTGVWVPPALKRVK